MSDCPLWVLGDVTPAQIEAARRDLGPNKRLMSISDEGTIGYCDVPPQHVVEYRRTPNWLKRALRGGP